MEIIRPIELVTVPKLRGDKVIISSQTWDTLINYVTKLSTTVNQIVSNMNLVNTANDKHFQEVERIATNSQRQIQELAKALKGVYSNV